MSITVILPDNHRLRIKCSINDLLSEVRIIFFFHSKNFYNVHVLCVCDAIPYNVMMMSIDIAHAFLSIFVCLVWCLMFLGLAIVFECQPEFFFFLFFQFDSIGIPFIP